MLKLLHSQILLKHPSMLTRKLNVVSLQRLMTSKSASADTQPFIQPRLDFAKLQKFKIFDVMPKGLLMKNLDTNRASIDIENISNVSKSEFNHIVRDDFWGNVYMPALCDSEKFQLGLLFHLTLSKLESVNNQSRLEELTDYIINDDRSYLLPLTYIPLLNNLKLNKNYGLWIRTFEKMKRGSVKYFNEELITDLVEDVIPKAISLANGSTTKRRADNSKDFVNLSINENFDFQVFSWIIYNYKQLIQVPDTHTVNMILDIVKKIGTAKSEYQEYSHWLAVITIDLLLKCNDVEAAYSLFKDQPRKTIHSFDNFINYFGKIGNKEGLDKIWGEFKSSKITLPKWTFKIVLETYLNMGDLKAAQLTLNELINQANEGSGIDPIYAMYIIEGLIRTEPQSLNSVLAIINSRIEYDVDFQKHELMMVSLQYYTKFNQLDHFGTLFDLIVKELDRYLINNAASSSEDNHECDEDYWENYDVNVNPPSTIEDVSLTCCFNRLIKYNQHFHNQDNIERFFQTLIEPVVFTEYPNAQFRNSILNDLLKGLIDNLLLINNGNIDILIESIDLIKANFKDFKLNGHTLCHLRILYLKFYFNYDQ